MNIIDTIINKVVEYYKIIYSRNQKRPLIKFFDIKNFYDARRDPERYEKIKNIINSKLQHLNNCDLEYLTDLEDEQLEDNVDNKNKKME